MRADIKNDRDTPYQKACYLRHYKCAGVALIFHFRPERNLTFTSSSDPKNPAKEFWSALGRLRVCRKSRCRNWSVEEITAAPMGRYSWVPCAQASPFSLSIQSPNPIDPL